MSITNLECRQLRHPFHPFHLQPSHLTLNPCYRHHRWRQLHLVLFDSCEYFEVW